MSERRRNVLRRVVMKLFKSKPLPVPTELDLKLVEALQAVTDCAEAHDVCPEVVHDGREALDIAKAELGLRS